MMMKPHEIRDSEKILAYLSLFTDFDTKKGKLVDWILDQIPDDPDIGFAGCSHKDGLRAHLKWAIGEINDIGPISEDKTKIAIEETVKKCFSAVSAPKPLHIFVFPTFDTFVKERMNGVAGYSFWRNTILVYINPVDGWDTALRSTICHEFAHAVAQNYNKMETILDQLIFDGVAEHFRDSVVNGDKAPWVKALTKEEAMKIFDEIKDDLDSVDENTRNEIFYGTGKYQLWSGYAIGYFIVGNFLKKLNKIDWNEILKMPPRKIFEESEMVL